MEDELNYLSVQIELIEHDIDIALYSRFIGEDTEDQINKLETDKMYMERILNYITENEFKN